MIMGGAIKALADNQRDFLKDELVTLLNSYRRGEDWISIAALTSLLADLSSLDILNDQLGEMPEQLSRSVRAILVKLPAAKLEDSTNGHQPDITLEPLDSDVEGEAGGLTPGADEEEVLKRLATDLAELEIPEPDEETSEEAKAAVAQSKAKVALTIEEVYRVLKTPTEPPPPLQPELAPVREPTRTWWATTRKGFRYPVRCSRCSKGNMSPEYDEYGEFSTCLQCGYVYEHITSPPIDLLEEEDGSGRPKQRRRQPSHGKIRL